MTASESKREAIEVAALTRSMRPEKFSSIPNAMATPSKMIMAGAE
jgi:hypothetical protein